MGWKRRSKAESFSKCLRNSSSVVAPMIWISPRDSGGFKIAAASMEPRQSRADERVHLVDEQDDVTRVLHLFDALLQTVLELAAILAARHKRRHVKREQALVAQKVGYLVRDDKLREPASTTAVLPTPGNRR